MAEILLDFRYNHYFKCNMMLRKEELRIGNWIKGGKVDGHSEMDEQVLAITPDGIGTSNFRKGHGQSSGITIFHQVDPALLLPFASTSGILITSEWLTQFGFILDNYEYQIFGKSGYWVRWNRGQCQFRNNDGQIGNTLEYVHQLQNLYYALTSEELNRSVIPK
jgi:hypothetical protein